MAETSSEPERIPVLTTTEPDLGVGTITLNRPSRRNALNAESLASLDQAVSQLARDESVHVIILTGAGGSFCSGVDTNELSGGSSIGPHSPGPGGPEALRQGFKLSHRVILSLFNIEKPVIAAIDGPAVGAGLDLACACDLRIATPEARFSAAYIKVGLFPGYGGVWFYPRLLGMAKAAELMLTGDFLDAEQALAAGFLNKVVPKESLVEESGKLANRIAAGPPIATRLAKTMTHASLGVDLATALDMSAAAESITLSSADHAEGMAAAREGRSPHYRGV